MMSATTRSALGTTALAPDAVAEFAPDVWRQALRQRLAGFRNGPSSRPKDRSAVLDALKHTLQDSYTTVQSGFRAGRHQARCAIRQRAQVVDLVIEELYAFITTTVYPSNTPTRGEQIAVIATGGYGRGELAPCSDIDLMFLLPHKIGPRTKQICEYMLYLLWDMGLTVGHATRHTDEALRLSREDLTIQTALLESRHLIGNRPLTETFQRRFENEVMANNECAFIEAKLAERDRRHARMGDTRYVLEPNIKEGKGGLRDLQTLFWIARYIYRVSTMTDLVKRDVFTRADARLFNKAANFIWTVRCHLHERAERADDRLTLDMQPEIGRRMGYTDHAGALGVERFMKHHFLIARDVGDLTRILCAVLEDQQKKNSRQSNLPRPGVRLSRSLPDTGFTIENGRLSVRESTAFTDQPVRLINLFRLAHELRSDIHPQTLRLVKQNLGRITPALQNSPVANEAFLKLLCARRNPERMLTAMNEAGVFGRFVPDFGRIVAQMQFDMYHVYTVDEHTIRALGILSRIENGELSDDHPVSARVIREIQSRRVLYVAVLLHDIAKGRKGDHSKIGAEIALNLCPRFGLNAWETETVSWLVRYHLLMSMTAFKRDLDDPRAIRAFAEQVQSPERLRLLLILTVADIRAVGPKVWNAWKARLLRDLYYQAQEVLTGEALEDTRSYRTQQARGGLAERLSGIWPEADIERYMGLGRDAYWLAFDTETHVRHAETVRDAWRAGKPYRIATKADTERDITELIVYAPGHPGLFASIAGAMALGGASVMDARIVTQNDGMALDTFWFQSGEGRAFDDPGRLQRLHQRIGKAVRGELRTEREIARAQQRTRRSKATMFVVPSRVLIDNVASTDSTVIEVNCRNRLGLLFDLTSVLTRNRLQISSAHISTFGERVVDVFYVRDSSGLKIDDERRLDVLRTALLAAAGENLEGTAAQDTRSSDHETGRHTAAAEMSVAREPATRTG